MTTVSARPVGAALAYHAVRAEDVVTGDELVPTVSVRVFGRHVRHLARRYNLLVASELHSAVVARRRGQRPPVAITFDDDHACYVPLVAPVLARERVRATFFLNGASLEVPRWFPWELLQAAWDHGLVDDVLAQLPPSIGEEVARSSFRPIKAISLAMTALPPDDRTEAEEVVASAVAGRSLPQRLTADDVRSLASEGHEIGFHTVDHPHLTELSDEELDAALTEGREQLEDHARSPITTIGYPFGCWDDRVARAAARAGFRYGFTTEPSPVRPSSDPLALGRMAGVHTTVGALWITISRTLHRGVAIPGAIQPAEALQAQAVARAAGGVPSLPPG